MGSGRVIIMEDDAKRMDRERLLRSSHDRAKASQYHGVGTTEDH